MWPNIKQWLKEIWTKSWTRAFGIAKITAGCTIAIGTYIGNIVNDPGVRDAFHQLNVPTWVGLGIAVLGAMTLLSMAHRDA